ncbi:MAG: hypothetical protein IPK26_00955 [Planctomycetes bacterium]|nr:hypothetical protein [Planctomycetota bacterium]
MTKPPDLPLPSDWSPGRLRAQSVLAWLLLLAIACRHEFVWGGDLWWLLHTGEGLGLVAFTLLAGLAFAQGIRQASSLPLSFLLGTGITLTVLATIAPPFLSSDVFDYLARGRVEVLGYNPYTTTAQSLAADPRMAPYIGDGLAEWTTWVMPYGPIAARLQWLLAHFDSPWVGVYLWKALCAVAHVAAGWLLYLALRKHGERDAHRGLVLWLWNPWLLLENCNSAHNDALQALLLAAMVAGLAHAKAATATTSFGLSVLTKHGSAPFGPLLLGHAIRSRQVGGFAIGVAASATVALGAWWIYFREPGALDFLSKQADVARSSASALVGMALGAWAAKVVVGLGGLLMLTLLVLGWRRAEDTAMVGRFGVLLLAVFVFLCVPNFAPWYHLWWLPLFALANHPTINRAVELLAWVGPFSYLVYASTRSFGIGHQLWQFALAGLWPILLLLMDWRGIGGMVQKIAAAEDDGPSHKH